MILPPPTLPQIIGGFPMGSLIGFLFLTLTDGFS